MARTTPIPSSVIIQPSPYAIRLVDALKPYTELKTILPRRRLHLNVRDTTYCYLIVEGRITLHRLSDDKMLATVSSPAIFGMARQFMPNIDIYLTTVTPTLIGKMPAEQAEKWISELGLWESLSKHMMVIMEKLYVHNVQVSAPTVFEIVCAQLQELMSEAHSLRGNVTAEQYIRNKTSLSRSRVMQVLADLKKGGYIDIERGILIRVNQLPGKY